MHSRTFFDINDYGGEGDLHSEIKLKLRESPADYKLELTKGI
jgi:hypothetical protein